jgi:outer membrane receptor protein involved in Fe transport
MKEYRTLGWHLAVAVGVSVAAAPFGAVLAQTPTLAEIIVTAQKRSQDIQEVPVSMTVLDATTLQHTGATDFTDYAARIPNLSFSHATSGQFGSQSPAIRGVYGQGATGFYIDETPVPESMNPRVADLERIEVLRGPQGTLYGARSMGGTIRLITKQPDPSDFAASLHGTAADPLHGTFDYGVDGYVNVPVVSNTAALRLSAYQQFESGLFDRVPGLQPALPPTTPTPSFAPHDHVDGQRIEGGQIAGLIKLADGDLTLRPRIAVQHWRSDGLPYADVTADNFTQVRLFDLNEPGWEDWQHYSLALNWHVTSGEIVSSTALLRRSDSTSEDYSEVAVLLFGIPPTPALMVALDNFRRIVHETRFISNFTGPVQVTGGIFYSNTLDRLTFPDDAITGLDALLGGALGTDIVFSQRLRTTTREAAAFGELSYAFTDQWKATLGVRAFDNSVDFNGDQYGIAVNAQTIEGRQEERKMNPKVLVEYQVTEGQKLYATAAQGFRIGGVNSFSNTLCAADLAAAGLTPSSALTYKSDTLWSYELGAKTTWLDRRVTADGALFYIDWSNIQQLVPLPTCGFFVYVNAGKAYSKGAEFELDAAVTDSLTASIGLGYTLTKITDNGGIALIATGVPIQQVPKWTATVSGEYHFQMIQHPGFVRADYGYTGESYSANNDFLNPRLRPSYAIANLHSGLTFDRIEAGLFVNNLTDAHANFSDIPPVAIELPLRPRIVTNRPRTVGLEARVRF